MIVMYQHQLIHPSPVSLKCLVQVFTYVLFVTFHVVCKHAAAQLVRPKEAEVAGDFSGYGGGQTLEEPLRTFILQNGFYHWPHWTSHRTDYILEICI